MQRINIRNTETNRCRLLETASSSLTPCAANQERNPATNRCRLIASSASQLKPCAAHQERNPETNRCRLAASSSIPSADHSVSSAASSNSPIAWLSFIAVSILALGYAIWEWRREIGAGFQSMLAKIR